MAAKTYQIKVQDDHLEKLARSGNPVLALAELVWNAVDADAENVRIEFEVNELGGLDSVRVSDDGQGLNHNQAERLFSSLGGSWKRSGGRSKQKQRILHGQDGRGRFRAFSLARSVVWDVTYADSNQRRFQFRISMSKDVLGEVQISDPVAAPNVGGTGVSVSLTNLEGNFPSLLSTRPQEILAQLFALYLWQYRDVTIVIDGQKIDNAANVVRVDPYTMDAIKGGDGSFEVSLDVVEWKMQSERSVFICNADGFPLEKISPRAHVQGFFFTAYLKSDYFSKLLAENRLDMNNMDSLTQQALEQSKNIIRDHFRKRAAEQCSGLLEQWREQEVYPYKGSPASEIEKAEREVFDILAVNLNQYLPSFERSDNKTKRFSLALLRNSLENAPSDLSKIVTEVLELPKDKREELASLLHKTTLAHIINASKIVADRMEFLKGLEELIFDSVSKQRLLERTQLHRILAEHAWIFGEQYHLSVDDQSLTEVLRKHAMAKKEDVAIDLDKPVLRGDGSRGLVDLMFSRNIQLSGKHSREHLVVEIKRPSVRVGLGEITQVMSYALAVSRDERFKQVPADWNFWVISNEMTQDACEMVADEGTPSGQLFKKSNPSYTVWVKTWGELINDCKARMQFFSEKLEYKPSREEAIQFLRANHGDHLPSHLSDSMAQPNATDS